MAEKNFEEGINNVYNWKLGHSLSRIYRKHHHLFEAAAARGDKREFSCKATK
jgi:hypothetical protein